MSSIKVLALILAILMVLIINWWISDRYFAIVHQNRIDPGKISPVRAMLTILIGLALPVVPLFFIGYTAAWALWPSHYPLGLIVLFSWLLPTTGIVIWHSRRDRGRGTPMA
jgi:hypothetical protein